MSHKIPVIGFIGQGFVGKNYADDFERRGYSVVRYALEPEYRGNKMALKTCDIVFVCVPTPTTPRGFDDSVVRSALSLVPSRAIAVVKSTLLPGTTRSLHAALPKLRLLCSPEFLSVATAAHDASNPFINIIGVPSKSRSYMEAAKAVHAVLPHASTSLTMTSDEAELFKYIHNVSAYMQILTINACYDIAQSLGASWKPLRESIEADPTISSRYSEPLHKSGRGAGGACFIKDFAAFRMLYDQVVGSPSMVRLLKDAERTNQELLIASNKDIDLLKGVYGGRVSGAKGPTRKKGRS